MSRPRQRLSPSVCMVLGQPKAIREGDQLGDLVGLDHTLGAIQRLLRELLDICLSRDIICYSVLGCILVFCLPIVSMDPRPPSTRQKPTCSSLSIRLVVYRSTSSSVVWSCFARIWLTTQYSPAAVSQYLRARRGEATTYTNRR